MREWLRKPRSRHWGQFLTDREGKMPAVICLIWVICKIQWLCMKSYRRDWPLSKACVYGEQTTCQSDRKYKCVISCIRSILRDLQIKYKIKINALETLQSEQSVVIYLLIYRDMRLSGSVAQCHYGPQGWLLHSGIHVSLKSLGYASFNSKIAD